MACTASCTSGAQSLSFAQAHKQLDNSCGFMPRTFAGIDFTKATMNPFGVLNWSDNCAMLHRTFAEDCAFNWSCTTRFWTRACSLESTGASQLLGCRHPFLFKVASWVYAADAWKKLKIIQSIATSKRSISSIADSACFISDVNLFALALSPGFFGGCWLNLLPTWPAMSLCPPELTQCTKPNRCSSQLTTSQ